MLNSNDNFSGIGFYIMVPTMVCLYKNNGPMLTQTGLFDGLSMSNIQNKFEIEESLPKFIECIKIAEKIAIPLFNIKLETLKLSQD